MKMPDETCSQKPKHKCIVVLRLKPECLIFDIRQTFGSSNITTGAASTLLISKTIQRVQQSKKKPSLITNHRPF